MSEGMAIPSYQGNGSSSAMTMLAEVTVPPIKGERFGS